MSTYYAQNNNYGGVTIDCADSCPTGFTALTQTQTDALFVAPLGSTIDANGNVVLPPAPNAVAQAQAQQTVALYRKTRQTLIGNFQSSALGSAYTYPSGLTDQMNLIAAATVAAAVVSSSSSTASVGTATMVGAIGVVAPAPWTVCLWCAYAGGVWAFTSHTAAQVQQVLSDWVAFKQAQSQALVTAIATVQAAATVAAVQAVSVSLT